MFICNKKISSLLTSNHVNAAEFVYGSMGHKFNWSTKLKFFKTNVAQQPWFLRNNIHELAIL